MTRRQFLLQWVVLIAFEALAIDLSMCDKWWESYQVVASGEVAVKNFKAIEPDVVRGGYYGGWYGFWYLDDQERMGYAGRVWKQLKQSGIKPLLYYDVGEVGDYVGFFGTDGKMRYNGWSIPFWRFDEPLIARWFGLFAFMQNPDWSPFPTAKDYGLDAFTSPDGKPIQESPEIFYSVLSCRDIKGEWSFDYFSNEKITDEIAHNSSLAKISWQQQGKPDVRGKSGWVTVRLVHVDFANPQLLEYQSREIERLIRRLRPIGFHMDNFGDLRVVRADASGFGVWSTHRFREFLRKRCSQEELSTFGIADLKAFDIANYIRTKGLRLQDPKWTHDPLWLRYLVFKVETGLQYHRRLYDIVKQTGKEIGYDILVSGNLIPLSPGSAMMKGWCDIAHFEWSTTKGWWGMKAMGLPPDGRSGYVVRLGKAISNAGYCWVSLYVPRHLSGEGHENLHKVLAFDCFVNGGLLDFGHWFLDGYSPGTPESAGFINRFLHRLPNFARQPRQFAADVAVVHSPWSEIASLTPFHPVTEMFIDEYSGWCKFLSDYHWQWDVIPAGDIKLANLRKFPIVILPSVTVLTDEQVEELRRYVQSGGRLVITGATGSRYGPEKFLALREVNAINRLPKTPAVRIVADTPGVAYWRKGDAQSSQQMLDLLRWEGFRRRVEINAPATLGVTLSFPKNLNEEVMLLEFNNLNISVETDVIHPAPSCWVSIRLPEGWRGKGLDIGYMLPELNSKEMLRFPQGDIRLDHELNVLSIKTPPFTTYLIVFIRKVL